MDKMLLKIFVLLLSLMIIGVSALTDEEKEIAKALHDQCVEESGVDEGFITEANKGNLKPDPKFKCYLKCIMVTLGTLSDAGVDVDGMIDMLPEGQKAVFASTIQKCGTVKGGDLCETAFLTNVCYQADNPENFYTV